MTKKVPYHLGIILDGNRRWAKEKGLPSFEGHKKGLETVKKVIKWAKEKGIKILTLFVFSTENWNREKKEVDYLMRLAKLAIGHNLKDIHKKDIKVKIIGQREKLPAFLQTAVEKAENLTKNNKIMILNFALSYGGRAEIIEAVKNIIKNKIPPEKIDEKVIKDNLWTSDVDLIIRTGKEKRISNFLVWQSAYSELYFLDKYWPDFSKSDLERALEEYNLRQRRFGR